MQFITIEVEDQRYVSLLVSKLVSFGTGWLTCFFFSQGTAEVVYMRHADALAAMKRYNNLLLDGKPMKLELVGVNIVSPVPVPVPVPPMQTGILGTHPMNPSRRY